VANSYSNFNSATLVVPGSDLAGSLCDGIRTRPIYKALVSQGTLRNQLINSWSCLAPKNQVSSLKGKKIRIVVSNTDRVIPSQYQYELTIALKQHTSQIKIQASSLGHYATITKYFLTSND